MHPSLPIITFLAFGLSAMLPDPSACAQIDGKAKAQPIKLSAEELVKECMTSCAKTKAKYKGKTLRVTGQVGDIHDDILYLPVKAENGSMCVCIRYGEGNKPVVKKGEKATFEGEFNQVAVLGPALVKCKLVKDDGKRK